MLPQYLRDNALFCIWDYEKKDGRRTKIPYEPRAPYYRAKTNDETSFGAYDEAVMAKEDRNSSGIGILLTDDICGIDIDHCTYVHDRVENIQKVSQTGAGLYGANA